MVKWLTRFALKNGAVVLIAMLMVTGGGIVSYLKIPNADYPDVDIPWIHVDIDEPGATPQQVYQDIGKVLEPKFSGLDGVKKTYSFSSTGHQEFDMEFGMDRSNKDIDRDIQDAINAVKLPDNVKKPQIQNSTISGDAAYIFSVSSDSASLQEIQTYAENTLKPALGTVSGVGNIMINGDSTKNIYVQLDVNKMKDKGITWQQVQQALVANNFASPIGSLSSNTTSMPIVVGGNYQTLDDIKRVPIVFFKQNPSGLTDAFQSVRSGFGAVSSAMGQLGQNEGVLQGEIQYIEALQALATQLMSDNTQLQALMTANQQHPSSDTEKQISQSSKKVDAEQAQIKAMQQKLGALQNQLGYPHASQAAGAPDLIGSSSAMTAAASVVPLGDVANVVYKDDPTNGTITRTNGKPGVVVRIVLAAHANTIQVVKDVQNVLHTTSLPAGYHTDELVNTADGVKHSVNGMVREAALGALFATIVTLLFLRDLRATIVALFSIPLSILAAVIVMNQMGYSLNVLTLSGIAVAVGRVVDDSIVVIENIYRRLKMNATSGDTGLLEDATREVGTAITSSTITTIAVFAPMTVVPGIVGHVFAPFAWTVIIALAFSLIVALMVVPLIARWSLLSVRPTQHKESFLQRGYRKSLQWSLQHKWVVIVISVLLLVESGFAATKLGFNFLPSGRVQMYTVSAAMPTASSLDAAKKVTTQIEQLLTKDDGVKTFQSFVDPMSPTVYVNVKDDVKDTDAFASDLRQRLKSVTGAKRVTVSGNSGIGDPTVHLMLTGANYDSLKQASEQAVQVLSKIPGLTDVATSIQASMPQVQVNVDADAAGRYGLDPMQVAGTIRNMVNGSSVTSVNYQGRQTDIFMTLGQGDIQSMANLGDQTLLTPTGDKIKLNQISTLSTVKGPTTISRMNQQQFVQVTGMIVSDNQSGVTAQVNKAMASLSLPAGVSYSQEGASQDMNQGFRNIGIAMIVSFVLVLIVMLLTFGAFTAPLAIVFALPFAVVGGFNGLWLTHQPLGMPGMIGFMMLIGIIVTNAIVLMDRVERQLKHGLSVREALLEAGVVRLRPILMTATATIGALIPLTISSDAGLISQTLAIVVIGGLVTSTLLTLVIVPIMYEWFYKVNLSFRRKPKTTEATTAVKPSLAE